MSTPHRAGLSTASGTPAMWLSQPPPRLGGPRRPSRLPDSACSLLQSRRQDERYGAERGGSCRRVQEASFLFIFISSPGDAARKRASCWKQRTAEEPPAAL